MRLPRKFTKQPALTPYVAEELLPGPAVNTDADFEANIRLNANSNLQPVGTCRMRPDGGSVVDRVCACMTSVNYGWPMRRSFRPS